MKIIPTTTLIAFFCLSLFLQISHPGKLSAQNVYELDLKRELSISLSGLSVLAYSRYKKENLEPIDWRIVQTWDRSEVPAYDRAATYNNSKTAEHISDYLNLGLMLSPGIFITSSAARNEKYSVAVMYSETLLWSTALSQLAKVTFQRRRPFVFNEVAEFDRKPSVNARMSFISGHTTASAAMAFLSASMYRDFYPDRNHVWSWSLAATLPLVVGYTRYEAGEHFLTDVAAGYVVGGFVGLMIPKLHQNRQIQISPSAPGLGLNMNITF